MTYRFRRRRAALLLAVPIAVLLAAPIAIGGLSGFGAAPAPGAPAPQIEAVNKPTPIPFD